MLIYEPMSSSFSPALSGNAKAHWAPVHITNTSMGSR